MYSTLYLEEPISDVNCAENLEKILGNIRAVNLPYNIMYTLSYNVSIFILNFLHWTEISEKVSGRFLFQWKVNEIERLNVK
jgi:hypothetical protein